MGKPLKRKSFKENSMALKNIPIKHNHRTGGGFSPAAGHICHQVKAPLVVGNFFKPLVHLKARHGR